MTLPNIGKFFDYSRERYYILLKKNAGQSKPWTDDPILQSYRFCNIFREDDTTTAWFREKVRNPHDNSPKVLQNTLIFRWFNKIETGEALLENGLFEEWDRDKAEEMLREYWKGRPLINSAYIIKTPNGMDKLAGILWSLDQILPHVESLADRMVRREWNLEKSVAGLSKYPYLGNFMAYETVTDLRHTYLLNSANDIFSWANPGPGAARGMCRVLDLPLNHYKCNSPRDRVPLISGMRHILEFSKDNRLWPREWPSWEMRDVEHTLCEFDKYERARTNCGKPKQRYQGV